ncbi:hypothetical protein EV182_000115 [Spiromyces aspiralis]|uniref:Uncharacterized protein n=1 Tax=Spiromyces aspiralis TaxID=68401 RepID=A0ACC1I2M7_9FUNG|nr:hypothetical protein EV182_000115 [Spiromyces aspiralis]
MSQPNYKGHLVNQQNPGIRKPLLPAQHPRRILPYPVQVPHGPPSPYSLWATQKFVPIVPSDAPAIQDAQFSTGPTSSASATYLRRQQQQQQQQQQSMHNSHHIFTSSSPDRMTFSPSSLPQDYHSDPPLFTDHYRQQKYQDPQYPSRMSDHSPFLPGHPTLPSAVAAAAHEQSILGGYYYACSPVFLDPTGKPDIKGILSFLTPSSAAKHKETAAKSSPLEPAGDSASGGASIINDLELLLNGTTKLEPRHDGKPPFSYATLIAYAILTHHYGKMTLSEIYDWMMAHFPHFDPKKTGWRNSIRHNLSLNKIFVHVPRALKEPGKGSYWTLDLGVLRRVLNVSGRHKKALSRNIDHPPIHPISPAVPKPAATPSTTVASTSRVRSPAALLPTQPPLPPPQTSSSAFLSSAMMSTRPAEQPSMAAPLDAASAICLSTIGLNSPYTLPSTIPPAVPATAAALARESKPTLPSRLASPSLSLHNNNSAADLGDSLFGPGANVMSDEAITQFLLQRRPSSASPTLQTRKMPRLSISALRHQGLGKALGNPDSIPQPSQQQQLTDNRNFAAPEWNHPLTIEDLFIPRAIDTPEQQPQPQLGTPALVVPKTPTNHFGSSPLSAFAFETGYSHGGDSVLPSQAQDNTSHMHRAQTAHSAQATPIPSTFSGSFDFSHFLNSSMASATPTPSHANPGDIFGGTISSPIRRPSTSIPTITGIDLNTNLLGEPSGSKLQIPPFLN